LQPVRVQLQPGRSKFYRSPDDPSSSAPVPPPAASGSGLLLHPSLVDVLELGKNLSVFVYSSQELVVPVPDLVHRLHLG